MGERVFPTPHDRYEDMDREEIRGELELHLVAMRAVITELVVALDIAPYTHLNVSHFYDTTVRSLAAARSMVGNLEHLLLNYSTRYSGRADDLLRLVQQSDRILRSSRLFLKDLEEHHFLRVGRSRRIGE